MDGDLAHAEQRRGTAIKNTEGFFGCNPSRDWRGHGVRTRRVPAGRASPGKPVTRRAPEGAVLQRNVLQKKGKIKNQGCFVLLNGIYYII